MNETVPTSDAKTRKDNPLVKLALELGPLVLFFFANAKAGIFTATALFMVAVVISLGLSRILLKEWPVMPLISAVVVLIFGGMTLYWENEIFIKLKPTIVNTLFGIALLIGLAFGKPLLSIVMGSVFRLTDEGWKKLTFRWALFFFVLAALNEIVWRTQTSDVWVNFKVFGIMPLTIIFALSQAPLISRYEQKDD
ncbi:MAG: septation protein A [Beijerinckiaceae bacterium]|nr:septation protein A [Beijerinckiaceae bacterium]